MFFPSAGTYKSLCPISFFGLNIYTNNTNNKTHDARDIENILISFSGLKRGELFLKRRTCSYIYTLDIQF